MESNFTNRLRKESLEKRLADYNKDYEGLERDYKAASDADVKNRLQFKLDNTLEEMKKVENDLQEIKISNIQDLIIILNTDFDLYKSNILNAYNLSLPNRLINKQINPNDAMELIKGLQLPHDKDACSYMEKFVIHLLLEQSLSVNLNGRLNEWAEQNINNCQQLIQHLKSELNEKQQQYFLGLMVAISERRGKYIVESWLNKNITQYGQSFSSNFEQLTINQQTEIVTDETLSNVPELLKKMIAQICCKYQKSIKQIHVFLPAKLMNYAVDYWENWQENENDYSTTIGDEYEVLLRCSERLRGNDPSVIKWREKANILRNKFVEPAEKIFILASSDNPRSLFKQFKLNKDVLAVKITTVFQNKEPGTLLWQASVPLALWVRKQLPQIINQSALDKILKDCYLEQVPDKVKQERLSAFDCDSPENHVGRHLCLLWDDPNVLPPEQRVTQNYL